MSTAHPVPRRGDIWRAVDPRRVRHIRILSGPFGDGTVIVRRVDQRADGTWFVPKRAPSRDAKLERFNGKRNGYAFVTADPDRPTGAP